VNRLSDLQALVRKHQAGVLLDTNVLLLHLARLVSLEFAQRWKRTQFPVPFGKVPVYDTAEQYADVLLEVLTEAKRCNIPVITTPQVLTEVSNFVNGDAKTADEKLLQQLFNEFATENEERFVEAKLAAKDEQFNRLGLSDISLILLGVRSHKPLVITLDALLCLELERRQHPVANLTHYAFD
jgi:hypothetical protein